MSWDLSFMAADMAPPPVAEMPADWSGDRAEPAADLRARVSQILPGTDWSDPAWGLFASDDVSLELNMGADDPCSSFVVHARGNGDVVGYIERLAEMPGWYAIDISQGEWLHHRGSAEAGKAAFDQYRDQIIESSNEPSPSGGGLISGNSAVVWQRMMSAVGRFA